MVPHLRETNPNLTDWTVVSHLVVSEPPDQQHDVFSDHARVGLDQRIQDLAHSKPLEHLAQRVVAHIAFVVDVDFVGLGRHKTDA